MNALVDAPVAGPGGAVARAWARLPWWGTVLVVYAGARVWSAAVLLGVARHQVATLWTGADPSYLQYTGVMWDASWYRLIA